MNPQEESHPPDQEITTMKIPAQPDGLKIEKGIPLPFPRFTGLTQTLKNMEVGDSIVIPVIRRTNLKGYADRLGIKITTRKIDTNNVRVWRIK